MKQTRKLHCIAMTLILFCATLALTGCGISLDDAKKLQEYHLELDHIPSISSVVGEREVTKASSGKENNNPFVKYTYTSDSIKGDLTAYIDNLEANGWKKVLNLELKGVSGKTRLEAKSMAFEKILVMDINYDKKGYTIKTISKKGIFTPK